MPFGKTREDIPPEGWTAFNGVLRPDRTVDGYVARLQEVRGHCYFRECKRSCRFELQRMQAAGWGRIDIGLIQKFYRCQRPDGCGLEYSEEPRTGSLPLRALLGRSHVSAKIACESCKFFRRVSIEGLIKKLRAEGVGDEATSFTEVAPLIKGACKCGRKSWKVEILWPNTDTLGWRQGLRD